MLPPSDATKLSWISIHGALNRIHKAFCRDLPKPREFVRRRRTKDEVEKGKELGPKKTWLAIQKAINERIEALKVRSAALSACDNLENLGEVVCRYLEFIEHIHAGNGDEWASADLVLGDLRQLKSILHIAYSHPHEAARRADRLPKIKEFACG